MNQPINVLTKIAGSHFELRFRIDFQKIQYGPINRESPSTPLFYNVFIIFPPDCPLHKKYAEKWTNV